MKKYFVVVMLIVLSGDFTYGQTHQDSINTYNKLNKWAVVKLTIAYMEDFEMNQENEKITYDNLRSKYKNYDDNVDLGSFEEELTQSWNTTKTKIYEKYKKELVDSATKLNFKNISFVPPGNTNSREKALSDINIKYDSLIQADKKPTKVKESPKVGIVKKIVPKVPVDNNETSLSKIIMYLILAVSILLNIIFYLKYKSPTKKQDSGNGNAYDDLNQYENNTLKNKIRKLEDDNASLKDTIKKYSEKPISVLKEDQVIINEEKPIDDERSPSITLDVKQVQNPIKTIYLPPPFEERKFAVEDVSENEKPMSLYVAKIDSKTNKGNISLIETANLSIALNSPNLYLETVCEYENPYNALAKGIKVIKDGELYLEGEDWIVKKKIRIKFI